jgi:hypothetical protein
MPNHERKLYHPDDSDNDLRREIQTTGLMVNGAWVKKSRYGDGITFGCFCFSLLFFSSLDLGPVQMASARVFTTFGVSQVEVDFPRAPDLPKGYPERCQSVAGRMISYEYVRGMIV